MGSPDVRAFSRNKRGIAGSLIWINFDRHALLNVVRKAAGKFIANIDDIRPQFRAAESQFMLETAIFDAQTTRGNGIPVGATIDEASMPRVMAISGALGGFKESAVPWYSDQILPFDITLAGANENGAAASMKIFGVEILNEGNGVSIDDAVSEMQATFVFTRGTQSYSLGCFHTWAPSLHPPLTHSASAAAPGPLTCPGAAPKAYMNWIGSLAGEGKISGVGVVLLRARLPRLDPGAIRAYRGEGLLLAAGILHLQLRRSTQGGCLLRGGELGEVSGPFPPPPGRERVANPAGRVRADYGTG
jgi:hypothetical protein